MTYEVNYQNWNGVFALPTDLVDQHLKLAGAVQLKVALWVFRQGQRCFTPEDAAQSLRLSTADVVDALQYWVAAGLFSESDAISPQPAQRSANYFEPILPETTASTPKSPTVVPRRQPKPTGKVFSERLKEAPDLALLMQEAQNILGKTISPSLGSTLLAAYDDYGLPVEVIIMLLQYVMSIGKISTNYIDAVAKGWAEEGIFSHDEAEKKLHMLSQLSISWRKIETVVGINHRSPSAREEQYTERWIYQWKFSLEMIREAYERCVNSTGKMTFSYMNKILERWYKNGIATPAQAKAEADARTKKRMEHTVQERTYDIDAFEELDFTGELTEQ